MLISFIEIKHLFKSIHYISKHLCKIIFYLNLQFYCMQFRAVRKSSTLRVFILHNICLIISVVQSLSHEVLKKQEHVLSWSFANLLGEITEWLVGSEHSTYMEELHFHEEINIMCWTNKDIKTLMMSLVFAQECSKVVMF